MTFPHVITTMKNGMWVVCMCAPHVEVRGQLKEVSFLLSYVCRRDGTQVSSLETSTSTH